MARRLVYGSATRLPSTPGRLIGRAAELAEITQLLRRDGEVRLLTLCGVGGIGKTRLAIEVARQIQADFTDGARFIELAPIREAELVVSAIHAAIAADPSDGRRPALDQLKRTLQPLDILLVLDNFEHVLEAAPVVAELLAACPRVTIVVTSRAPLHLRWEREFVVGPLVVPGADPGTHFDDIRACASVQLLLDRMAGSTRPGTESLELAALGSICQRLDGIPLAIELAAARAKVLAPTELLAWLARPLDVLTSGPRDMPERHQALRNTFEWSYELLEPGDRLVFRHLGVFVGGCSLWDAMRVCDTPVKGEFAFLNALECLVDSGLVSRVPAGGLDQPRLVLLEPVREYALEKLRAAGELELALQRHATTCLELAERADAEIRGPSQVHWLGRLDHEHNNALAALRWFIRNRDVERSCRLGAALCMFWWVRGYTREGIERIRDVLALGEDPTASVAAVQARAHALSMTGGLAYWLGDYDTAQTLEREALAAYGDEGDASRRAFALITLGNCAVVLGDAERSDTLYQASLELSREARDARGVAQAIMNRGAAALYASKYDQARELLMVGLSLLRSEGDRRGAAFGLRSLAMLYCHTADFEAANACVREALSLWREVRGRVLLPILLESAAMVAIAGGGYARGLQLAAAAGALRDQMQTPATPVWLDEVQNWLARARASIGEAAHAQLWEDGWSLSVEKAVSLALVDGGSIAPASPALPTRPEARVSNLTPRQAELLRLVASGHSNKEIARQLSISVGTVERHLVNVYSRIGARARAEAIAFAITHGLHVPAKC